MPRIRGASIEEHHELVWSELSAALEELLRERDYDAIAMGHIAARAGLARNTLYNYARDKHTLVLALTERAGRPMLERVTEIAGRSQDPAAERLGEVVEAVLDACTDQAMRLMFLPGAAPLVAEVPKGPQGPFHPVLAQVENIVRDGVASGEFRDVGDVRLAVELLAGVMHSAAERINRAPAAFAATLRSAREIILTSLAAR